MDKPEGRVHSEELLHTGTGIGKRWIRLRVHMLWKWEKRWIKLRGHRQQHWNGKKGG